MKVINIERVIILSRIFQYGMSEETKKRIEKTLTELLEMQSFDLDEYKSEISNEMYCKGIDDLCNEISTYRMYDEYGNVLDVLEIAKRLKAGGKNE